MKKNSKIPMIGKRFGKLTVISESNKDKRGECFWICRCDCGNTKTVSGYKLRSGNTSSCGCLQKEIRASGVLRRTHGMTKTRLYSAFYNMRSRCYYKKNLMYKNYGGRGIRVCEEWESFESFKKWAFANGYEEGLTLERIDVNKNYCPENCKWIPVKDQYLNRTDSHKITAFGKTQTLKEWADEIGIKYDTLERRINAYGWPVEKALKTPVK